MAQARLLEALRGESPSTPGASRSASDHSDRRNPELSSSDCEGPSHTEALGYRRTREVLRRRLQRIDTQQALEPRGVRLILRLRWISRARTLRVLEDWRHRPEWSPKLQWAAPRGPRPGPFGVSLEPGTQRTLRRDLNLAAVRRARGLLQPLLRPPTDSDVQFFFRVFDRLLCLKAQDRVAYLLAEVIHDVCQLRLLGHAGYLAGTAAVLRLLLRVQVRPAPLHGGEVHLADAPAPYTWPPSIVHARGRTSWWLHPDPAWSEITELVDFVPNLVRDPRQHDLRARLPAPAFYCELNGYFTGAYHFLAERLEQFDDETELKIVSPDLEYVTLADHSLSSFVSVHRRRDRLRGAASLRDPALARGATRCGVSDFFDFFGVCRLPGSASDLGLVLLAATRRLYEHNRCSHYGLSSEDAALVHRPLLQARATWAFRFLDFHLRALAVGRWLRLAVRLYYVDTYSEPFDLSRVPRSASLPRRLPGDGLLLVTFVHPTVVRRPADEECRFRPGIRFFVNLTEYRDLTSPFCFPLHRRFLDYFFTLVGLGYTFDHSSAQLLSHPGRRT